MIGSILDKTPNITAAGGSTNSIGLVINASNPLSPTNGGLGVSNTSTVTLGGNINTGGALTTAGSFTTSGAFPITLTATATTSVTLPTSGNLVNSGVTTLSSLSSIGTISTGTWQGTVIGATYGGTGINNGGNTITLGGNINTASSFSTSGANSLTLTTTGPTTVTLPTSGNLVNTAVTTLSSLASIGTITTGTWQGTVVGPTYGGTGVNNGSNIITLAGNFSTSGAFPLTLTTTGTTNVTLPPSGTLATVGSNGVAVTNVTGTAASVVDAAPVNIYVANNASQVTFTLPSTTTVGHVFKFVGAGGSPWKIAQLTGQSINLQANGATTSTTTGTGGSLTAGLSSDCVELAATVANTTFTVCNSYGGSQIFV